MSDERHLPWFEKLIRDAHEAGEFDDLEGAGKPIPDIDRFYEVGWWAKRFMERERVNDAFTELAARMRSELPRVLALRDESEARRRLEAFRDEIEALNRKVRESDRMPALDVDAMLEARRRRHS